MKGQVFLLTAGVIIAILVALRGFATVQQISSEKEILDVSLEDLVFRNVENEIKKLTEISVNSPRNISDNAIDFLNFTRVGGSGHSLDFRALFVGILANSTNETMNITVFNFLRETNLNVTIGLNKTTSPPNSTSNSTFLNDSSIWLSNFTFTRGESYNLTVTLPDRNYEENITFTTKASKDTYTGFFDLRLLSGRADHISKFYQTVKVS